MSDEQIIRVRIRPANLQALTEGVVLGTDGATGEDIRLSLIEQPDGIFVIQAHARAETVPDPVFV